MAKWLPWAGCGVAVIVVLVSIYLTDKADHRASVAEGRVAVFDSLRQVAEAVSKRDSTALEDARKAFVADSVQTAQERLRLRQEAVRAQHATQEASDALRATLDVQQTVLLDSLDASHAAELATAHRETAKADSATANEHGFRVAAELALASERTAHQAALPQIAALQAQVSALKSARRWDKWRGSGVIAAVVVAVIVLR